MGRREDTRRKFVCLTYPEKKIIPRLKANLDNNKDACFNKGSATSLYFLQRAVRFSISTFLVTRVSFFILIVLLLPFFGLSFSFFFDCTDLWLCCNSIICDRDYIFLAQNSRPEVGLGNNTRRCNYAKNY